MRPHDMPRPLVGNAQDNLAATRISQRHDILHQSVEVKAAFGFLELESHSFGLSQVASNLIGGDCHWMEIREVGRTWMSLR
jgi:hypothetical protein